MDYSPPSSSVHGTSQLRILEWVGIFSSRGSSWPRDGSLDSCIADSSPLSQQRSPVLHCAKSLQSSRTLCSPMDSRLPGSSVHGILQARLPKWVVISFSGGPSWPRDQTCVSWIGRWILYSLRRQGYSISLRNVWLNRWLSTTFCIIQNAFSRNYI